VLHRHAADFDPSSNMHATANGYQKLLTPSEVLESVGVWGMFYIRVKVRTMCVCVCVHYCYMSCSRRAIYFELGRCRANKLLFFFSLFFKVIGCVMWRVFLSRARATSSYPCLMNYTVGACDRRRFVACYGRRCLRFVGEYQQRRAGRRGCCTSTTFLSWR